MIQKDSIDYVLDLHKSVLDLRGLVLISFAILILILIVLLKNIIDIKDKLNTKS